jgi:purine-binding chemotaxis protein CheW
MNTTTQLQKDEGAKENQLCGFRVAKEFYAISVLDVQEVIRPQPITTIPLAPDYIRGLINLRGQIVTVISLKVLFGLPENEGQDKMNIIVSSGEFLYSLEVDEIMDVIDVDLSNYEDTPTTLSSKVSTYIKGVFKLEERLQILLDLSKILDIENK